MRKLVIMRGVPGCGKSHFLRTIGAEDYTLSTDVIRGLLSGAVLTPEGKMALNPQNERTWKTFFQVLEERMSHGETLFLDATHIKHKDVNSYEELAQRHMYDVALLDFNSIPLDQCKSQNKMRPEEHRVPDSVIERMYQLGKEPLRPAFIRTFISAQPDGSHAAAVQNW